jgi:hypothetical protein
MTDGRLRIGTAERDSAMKALDEHLSAGRIDIDEYGERSARAAAAVTAGDLAALFTDLPAPHPALPGVTPPAGPRPALPVPAFHLTGPPAAKRPAWASPFVLIPAAVVLFVLLGRFGGFFFWFLLMPAGLYAVHRFGGHRPR